MKTIFWVPIVLIYLLHARAQNQPMPSAVYPTLKLPTWLAAMPGAREEQTHVGANEIGSSYHVQKSAAEVIAHYRSQLQKSEIRFDTSFDGIGTAIRCSEGKASGVIQIRERDDNTSVKVSYSPNASPVELALIIPPAQPDAPAPVAAPTSPKKAIDDYPTVREVEYEITGTVHYANLTRKNADGSTEQRQEKLPYSSMFFAPPGTSLFLSVQKARITITEDFINPRVTLVEDGIAGTVYVRIRVGGLLLQEAVATAPYGIATASGEVAK